MSVRTKLRFGFNIFIILLFAYTGYQAIEFRTLARYLPLTVSVLGLIMGFMALAIDLWNYRARGAISYGEASETAAMSGYGGNAGEDAEAPGAAVRRAGVFALWILGYVALIGIVGLLVATALFLGVYLWFIARAGWKVTVIGIVAVLAGMSILSEALNLEWPEYLIGEFFLAD